MIFMKQSRKNTDPVTNVMTVDVEDWFQVENLSGAIKREDWGKYPLRIVNNVEVLLDIFSRMNVYGTFFILGWIAERLPELVKRISEHGHEIASHGWAHKPIWRMKPQEFYNDVTKTRSLLSEISKQPVLGFRAPTFSVTKKTLWAFEILKEAGHVYDSSVFPVRHDLYGIPDGELSIHRTASGIWEIPLSVVALGRFRVPVAGGGYLRLYPRFLTGHAIKSINREGRAAITYLHPWEFDPEQPFVSAAGFLKNFRHRVGITRNKKKVAWLLQRFRFGPAISVLRSTV